MNAALIRYKILRIVEANPGIHAMAICRKINHVDEDFCLSRRLKKSHKGRWRNLDCSACEVRYQQVIYNLKILAKKRKIILKKEKKPDPNPYRPGGYDVFLCAYPTIKEVKKI